jgi:hypothetical protein
MDGQSTDAIIDRILWGLANCTNKAQIEVMKNYFTVQKLNSRTKMYERVVRSEFETGERYRTRHPKTAGRLFDDEPLGDMPIKTLIGKFSTCDVMVIAMRHLKIEYPIEEASAFNAALEDGYARGHAGQQNDRMMTDGADMLVGGTMTEGKLIAPAQGSLSTYN